jgi:hypothetical protein
MLYLKCPTCRTLLGNKQLYFEQKMDEICKDCDMKKITFEEGEKKKMELVNFLIPNKDRYCCKMRLMTYRKLIDFVK